MWHIRVQRMGTDRLPKHAVQYRPKGKRNIGRPRKRRKDQLHLEGKRTGTEAKTPQLMMMMMMMMMM
jgi:hypothetical protein